MPALRRDDLRAAAASGGARRRATTLWLATLCLLPPLVTCAGACEPTGEAALAPLRPAFAARRSALRALAARLPPVGHVPSAPLAAAARPRDAATMEFLLASTLSDPDRLGYDRPSDLALAPLEGSLALCLHWASAPETTPPAQAAEPSHIPARETCERALAARDLVVVRSLAFRTGAVSSTSYRAGEATIEVIVTDRAGRTIRGATTVTARGPSRDIVERRRLGGFDVGGLRRLAAECLGDNTRRAVLDALGARGLRDPSSGFASVEQCTPDTDLDERVRERLAADAEHPNEPGAPPPGAAIARAEVAPTGGTLGDQLARHARAAREHALQPIAYFHAAWCAPCRAIARWQNDPAMLEAFRGAQVIGVDIDVWTPGELSALGFHVVGVPTWVALEPDGRPTERSVTSAEWGDDVPANMAPVLSAFVRGARNPLP